MTQCQGTKANGQRCRLWDYMADSIEAAAPLAEGEDFCAFHTPKQQCVAIKVDGRRCGIRAGMKCAAAAPLDAGGELCGHHFAPPPAAPPSDWCDFGSYRATPAGGVK